MWSEAEKMPFRLIIDEVTPLRSQTATSKGVEEI